MYLTVTIYKLIVALLFGDEILRNATDIGCIDPHCDVLSVAMDAYANAKFLCEQYYMTSPAVEYEVVNCKCIEHSTGQCSSGIREHVTNCLFVCMDNPLVTYQQDLKENAVNV